MKRRWAQWRYGEVEPRDPGVNQQPRKRSHSPAVSVHSAVQPPSHHSSRHSDQASHFTADQADPFQSDHESYDDHAESVRSPPVTADVASNVSPTQQFVFRGESTQTQYDQYDPRFTVQREAPLPPPPQNPYYDSQREIPRTYSSQPREPGSRHIWLTK